MKIILTITIILFSILLKSQSYYKTPDSLLVESKFLEKDWRGKVWSLGEFTSDSYQDAFQKAKKISEQMSKEVVQISERLNPKPESNTGIYKYKISRIITDYLENGLVRVRVWTRLEKISDF